MFYPIKHITVTTPAGRKLPVWYVHSEAEHLDDPDGREEKVPGIAPGKERSCADLAEQAHEKGFKPEAERFAAQGERWKTLADRTWPAVWASLARALPIVHAYVVVPSRRQARVVAPRTAMWTAYPDAIEIVYSKAASARTFGASERGEIVDALVRETTPMLPTPCKIAVLDDWLGRGETFDAMMERITSDFGGTSFDFVGAFPGVSQEFVPWSNRINDAVAHIVKMSNVPSPPQPGKAEDGS
ncbi:MAG: hypothetical protein V3V08_00590 [Nannocystaceae bacterium]